jgi:hypothetical protein
MSLSIIYPISYTLAMSTNQNKLFNNLNIQVINKRKNKPTSHKDQMRKLQPYSKLKVV